MEVRPAMGGVVRKVCFKAGAEVKKGDVLFELDPQRAQLTVDKAKAELAQAEAKKQQSDRERNQANRLLAQKVISTDEFDKFSGQVAVAEGAVNWRR